MTTDREAKLRVEEELNNLVVREGKSLREIHGVYRKKAAPRVSEVRVCSSCALFTSCLVGFNRRVFDIRETRQARIIVEQPAAVLDAEPPAAAIVEIEEGLHEPQVVTPEIPIVGHYT